METVIPAINSFFRIDVNINTAVDTRIILSYMDGVEVRNNWKTTKQSLIQRAITGKAAEQ